MLTEQQWDQLDEIFADDGRAVRMFAADAYIIVRPTRRKEQTAVGAQKCGESQRDERRQLVTITPRQFSECYEPLTAAEMRIVQTICAGYTKHEEIAAATGVKLRTVANHLYAIYKKLGVSNEAALVLYAIRAGWFDAWGNEQIGIGNENSHK